MVIKNQPEIFQNHLVLRKPKICFKILPRAKQMSSALKHLNLSYPTASFVTF
jgi:hypothetical protein